MNPPSPIDACRAARAPSESLAALASLRTKAGIRVRLGESVWIEWEGNRPEIVAALLAAPSVEFFVARDGRYHRFGAAMPAFDMPPSDEAITLERALFPDTLHAFTPSRGELQRAVLKLVRCERPHETRAIRVSIERLSDWAETAITAEITALNAIRFGAFAWIIGIELPPIADAERFWGDRVWVASGWRADPDWPESALREASNVDHDEILVIDETGPQAIPFDMFEPLTRAAIRRVR